MDVAEHASSDCLPGMDIHKQHQRLHSDHVDALTVKPCNFQHFQIRYTQHDQREEEREGVQRHGEHDELRPGSLRPDSAQRTRRVKVVVTDPGAAGGHCGEAKWVYPRVSQRHDCVSVPDSWVVAQREHHGHPSIDAERCHAEHRVCGEKSVEETHYLTHAVSPGVARGDEPD